MDLMAMIENAMASPVIYLAILVLAILDAFLPFLPSESVVIAAAVFAVSGTPSLPLIIVFAALGAFVGDHIGYLIGRLVRERRPDGRLIRAVDRITPHLHRRGGALIIAGRFVPGGRTAIVTATFESNPTLGLAFGIGLALSITALGELFRYVWRCRNPVRAGGHADAVPGGACGAWQADLADDPAGKPRRARHRAGRQHLRPAGAGPVPASAGRVWRTSAPR